MSTRSFKLLRIRCQIHGKADRSKCGCLVLVLIPDAAPACVQCSTVVGCVKKKVVVAVAVDHDVTAADGSGAIGRDAGSEAVDVSPDVRYSGWPSASSRNGVLRTAYCVLKISSFVGAV